MQSCVALRIVVEKRVTSPLDRVIFVRPWNESLKKDPACTFVAARSMPFRSPGLSEFVFPPSVSSTSPKMYWPRRPGKTNHHWIAEMWLEMALLPSQSLIAVMYMYNYFKKMDNRFARQKPSFYSTTFKFLHPVSPANSWWLLARFSHRLIKFPNPVYLQITENNTLSTIRN